MSRRVIQLLPTIAYGDAVSNDALAMSDVLSEMGYENEIYAKNIGSRVARKASQVKELKTCGNEVLIYHMSTGSRLSQMVNNLPNKTKIMVYHNITPAKYFRGYSSIAYDLCFNGREQLKMLNKTFDMSLADSNYNKDELNSIGYNNTYELPIILKFSDYNIEPDRNLIEKYNNDGYVNILFIGRVAPNKKQEDLIKSFYIYKKYINPRSRLFLIGSHSGMERYVQALNKLIEELELYDVYIPGHTSFKEILAYYKLASVFLCMSEHEGFCVPLIESMLFKVPIIAYKAAAVPETLANSGILVSEKKYEIVAELIDLIVTDKVLREKVIASQTERLKAFNENKVKEQFKNYIKMVI